MSYLTTFPNIRTVGAFIFKQSGGDVTIQANNPAAARTLTIIDPGGSDSFLFVSATQNIGGKTFSTDISAGSHKLTNLATPTASTDAANKSYVDAAIQGLDIHAAVKVASAAALAANTYVGTPTFTLTGNANGALTVDGIAVTSGMRVLVKNEVTATNNGIYTVTSAGSGGAPYVLTRATDMNTTASLHDAIFTFVEEGTALGGTGWVLVENDSATLDSTSLSFVQFGSSTTYTAGNGINISSGTITAVADEVTLHVAAGGIQIKSTYVGQSSITTLGTITTGTWTGTAIALANGGTNANITAAAGAVAYSTASALAVNTPVGSAGIPLVSGTSGTGAPTFSALNLAGAGTVSGNLPVANGGTGSGTAGGALTNLGAMPFLASVLAKSINYALGSTDQFVAFTTSTSNLVATIPQAVSGNKGQVYTIAKADAGGDGVTTGKVVITPTTSTVNGAATVSIYQQYDSISIISDGSNWITV